MSGSNGELIEPGAYDNIQDIPAFIKQMGRSVAVSKMCGVETEAQGEVLVFECLGRRCRIMSFGERYNFMHGKLTMKAETMLADFQTKVGGEFQIIERTSEAAEIALTMKGKEPQHFRLTWVDAQKEPFVYEGKEKEVLPLLEKKQKLNVKAKYQTPRSRMQMLWSRVVSDGVHTVAPQVTSGAYTPEEVEDFEEFQPGNGSGKDRKVPKDSMAAAISAGVAAVPVATATATVAPAADSTPTEPQYCTGQQSVRITELLGFLNPSEADIDAMKKRRNVHSWRQLTVDQADELIGKLKTLFDQRAATATAVVTAPSVTAPTVVRNNDPATESQVTKIRQLTGEINQSQPDFANKLLAKIHACGLKALADLTVSEADKWIRDMSVQNMEAFFTASLEGYAKFRPTTAETAATTNPSMTNPSTVSA